VRSRLRQDLTAALKARDVSTANALRSAIAAIENAEAVDTNGPEPRRASSEHIAGATAGAGSSDVQRRELSDADVIAVIRLQVQERAEAAGVFEQLGEMKQAERLRHEAAVLRKYLPTA
jgi:uncharacterized protein